jgi:hypothetical protein
VDASKHKVLSYQYLKKIEEQVKADVEGLTAQAEAADTVPVNDGMYIPAEVARCEERLAVMATAKIKVEARVQERFEREQVEYQEKNDKREGQRKVGKNPRGKEPVAPTPESRDKDKVNLMDEESRIMPISGGGF